MLFAGGRADRPRLGHPASLDWRTHQDDELGHRDRATIDWVHFVLYASEIPGMGIGAQCFADVGGHEDEILFRVQHRWAFAWRLQVPHGRLRSHGSMGPGHAERNSQADESSAAGWRR